MRKSGLLFVVTALLTAVPASTQAEDYRLVAVAEGLDFPWCVGFLPNGDLLVTELGGHLRRVTSDGVMSDPIPGVPEVYRRRQGGLFDVLPDPDFERNRTLYLSYAAGPADENATQVFRARLMDGGLQDGQVIYAVTPRKATAAHYGGRMAFLPDGTLLLTTGDGYNYLEQSQDLSSGLGKTMRIDTQGRAPDDNPFIGQTQAQPEIFTYGHRNPQGLAVASDGRIYLHEHGPRGGDETNLLVPGANYGWPAVTFGKDYSGAIISAFTEGPGFTQPLTHWVPSIAPSGLAIYEGSVFPDWQGDLFVGALVDREVRRLTLEEGQIVKQQALFGELNRRIRDVRTRNGYLYVLEDGKDATLWRVEPS